MLVFPVLVRAELDAGQFEQVIRGAIEKEGQQSRDFLQTKFDESKGVVEDFLQKVKYDRVLMVIMVVLGQVMFLLFYEFIRFKLFSKKRLMEKYLMDVSGQEKELTVFFDNYLQKRFQPFMGQFKAWADSHQGVKKKSFLLGLLFVLMWLAVGVVIGYLLKGGL